MPRRTHITVHEFSAVRDKQTGNAIVAAVPRIVKVARIEDVRPINDWDRGDALWEHNKKKPLPDEFRTQMTLTDGSLRFFITETVPHADDADGWLAAILHHRDSRTGAGAHRREG
jgi:hypothetical protein